MKMILEGSNSAETFFTVGWRYWITSSFDLGVVKWIVDQLFFFFIFFYKFIFYFIFYLFYYLLFWGEFFFPISFF